MAGAHGSVGNVITALGGRLPESGHVFVFPSKEKFCSEARMRYLQGRGNITECLRYCFLLHFRKVMTASRAVPQV